MIGCTIPPASKNCERVAQRRHRHLEALLHLPHHAAIDAFHETHLVNLAAIF
jgi:hypothetical protein